MDTDLTDLDGFLDGRRLILPIGGKKYTIEEASGETFLRLQRYGAALLQERKDDAAAEFDKLTDTELGPLTLGQHVFDQVVKAGVPGSSLQRAITAAFLWQIGQSADVVRAAFQGPKAPAAKKSRATKKAAPTTHTAGASTTRPRASGSGARSRRKS